MSEVKNKNNRLTLSEVRLSFPSLFKKTSFNGGDGKFEATFLINKKTQANQIKMLQEAIKVAVSEKSLKGELEMCLKDGDVKVESNGGLYAEYSGCMYLKAKTSRKPTTINKDKSEVVEEDDVLYSGCYVNARISFFGYDKIKKGVSCNLFGVQKAKEGEMLTTMVDVRDEFEEVNETDELFK